MDPRLDRTEEQEDASPTGLDTENGELSGLRQQIDEVDQQIVRLLNRRAAIALRIGELKRREGDAVYDPAREAALRQRLANLNPGPLPLAALQSIYTEILSASRDLQRRLRVAFLGPAGSFSHEAARKHFGSQVDYVPVNTIANVFEEASKGRVDYGLVPVENSSEGSVNHTLDLLLDSELKILAEVQLPISQNLVSRVPLSAVRRVYSHPQAIAQCRRWLSQQLAVAEWVEVSSTSLAAKMAAEEEGTAAIATETAARIYGLDILARGIEDAAINVTRFLVIGHQMGRRSGNDITSLVFSVVNRVGALHDALAIFQRRGIDLTRIESRPSRRKAWEYVFYVDLVGHPEDTNLQAALAELEQSAIFVKVLGAWPQGKPPLGDFSRANRGSGS